MNIQKGLGRFFMVLSIISGLLLGLVGGLGIGVMGAVVYGMLGFCAVAIISLIILWIFDGFSRAV